MRDRCCATIKGAWHLSRLRVFIFLQDEQLQTGCVLCLFIWWFFNHSQLGECDVTVEWSCNCLTDWYLVTRQWLRLQAWFFCCLMLPQPERCLLPCCCICNELTIALLCVPFIFAYHNKCRFAVRDMMVSICNRNRPSGYFDCRGSFQKVVDLYCCIMGWT